MCLTPAMRQITLKQRKFIKEYLRTGSPVNAAMTAYNFKKRTTASIAAYNNLHKSEPVKAYLKDLLDLEGLDDKTIAQSVKKIVTAGTSPDALKQATPKDAMNAIKFAAEVKDLMPAKKIEQKTATMNINVDGKSGNELNEVLSNLTREIKAFQEMTQKTKHLRSSSENKDGYL